MSHSKVTSCGWSKATSINWQWCPRMHRFAACFLPTRHIKPIHRCLLNLLDHSDRPSLTAQFADPVGSPVWRPSGLPDRGAPISESAVDGRPAHADDVYTCDAVRAFSMYHRRLAISPSTLLHSSPRAFALALHGEKNS